MILKATEASLDYCEGATSPGRWDESEKQPSESLPMTLSGGPGEMKLALIYLFAPFGIYRIPASLSHLQKKARAY